MIVGGDVTASEASLTVDLGLKRCKGALEILQGGVGTCGDATLGHRSMITSCRFGAIGASGSRALGAIDASGSRARTAGTPSPCPVEGREEQHLL